ncbi:hypothetical protein FQU75_14635 [Paenibacillus polymyxa]|nr:hypothetical protein FQU75_14635 [Paenibacillus polymyxa]
MSIQTDDDGKTFLSIFPTLSYEDRLVSLRELTAIPQPVEDTITFLLQFVQQSSADDLLRIALDLIRSDTYILVKGAAFALLRAHKAHPFAQQALKQLLQHEEFGASAQRELST